MNLFSAKIKIHTHCILLLEEKITDVKKQIAELNQADESKSSAGDKHETAKAMAQLEIEKLNKSLHQFNLQLQTLKKIDPVIKCNEVQLGALLNTDGGTFYIAVSLGKINLPEEIMVISAESPLFIQIRGKKIGDEFMMGNRRLRIEEIA